MRFARKTFQGAYVFTKILNCPIVGDYLKEVVIFADSKKEARQMAKELFRELTERERRPGRVC